MAQIMWGKLIKDTRLGWYPTIGIVLATMVGLAGTWLFAGRVLTRMSTQVINAKDLLETENKVAIDSKTPVATVPIPVATQPTVLKQKGFAQEDLLTSQANAEKADGKSELGAIAASRQGILRISNPTDYPVRVALLVKKAAPAGVSSKRQVTYEPPAHWDFAPQEGSTKGLIVSLPDRTLKIKQGDILVAFAQDGSGLYWGPYVVGETVLPTWSTKTREWLLTVQ